MARTNRNQPLPTATQPRVADSTAQRAFDLLFVPLREIIRFLQPFVQSEKWKGVTFQSPWADLGSGFHTTQYRKSPMGRVELRGLCYRTTGIATANEVMFVLPVNYRPSHNCTFPCPTNTGVTTVQVHADGTVRWQSGGYVNVFFDGITFDTVNE